MKKFLAASKFVFYTLFLTISGFLASLVPAQAVNVQNEFRNALRRGGLLGSGQEVPTLAQPVNALLDIVITTAGIGFLLLIIYAGFMWIFAAGNEERVKKAQRIIVGAVIGLIVVFLAFAITNFVLDAIDEGLGN